MCHTGKSPPSTPLSAGNYLHKKFKKVATAEDCSDIAVPTPVLTTDENSVKGVWRHKCPYCKTVCIKPSALAKHLQAKHLHSDERPFPCETCGFAFKTKSNLSKHCKSQSHTERLAKEEPIEEIKPKIYKPKFRTDSIYTKLEEDQSRVQEPTKTETAVVLSPLYKHEEDSSQPLNLSVTSIKKCNIQNRVSPLPVENGQTELKGVYKLLFNQVVKCNGTNKEQPYCEVCGLKFNSQDDLVRHICDRSPNGVVIPEPKTVAIPLPSPGPLLGRTPLVEFHRPKESDVFTTQAIVQQRHEMFTVFSCSEATTAVPFVPGIPGPHTGIPHNFRQQYQLKQNVEPPPKKKLKIEDDFVISSTSHHQVLLFLINLRINLRISN